MKQNSTSKNTLCFSMIHRVLALMACLLTAMCLQASLVKVDGLTYSLDNAGMTASVFECDQSLQVDIVIPSSVTHGDREYLEQKIITRKLARVTTSWNPTDIPEGWTVKQISTTSIVKSSTGSSEAVVVTALIEKD